MPVTARNADIDAAIEQLRSDASVEYENGFDADAKRLDALADRLAAVGRWPVRKNGRWLVNLIESNAKALNEWRAKIAAAAREAYDGEPVTRAVRVDIAYWFRRPKNHFRTGKYSHLLKATAPDECDHDQHPDRDKHDRAVNDALTQAGIWDDDKRNAGGCSWKRWLPSLVDTEGCTIEIYLGDKPC
jgi:Holliday junction resolvase RusA-like endonuclease